MRHDRFVTLPAACLLALFLNTNLCPAAEITRSSGIDRSAFDTSVKPGENFFRYVNGEWIKHNPIPPEYGRWGSFPKLRDDNLLALREILEDLAKDDPAKNGKKLDDNRRKLRDFYRTAMDEAQLDKLGVSPLADELARIAKIENREDLIAEIARQRADGRSALFLFYVSPDEKQSDINAAHLRQGGLGLPERDYYLGTTDDSKRIRGEYRNHVAKMLELLGDKPAEAEAGADAVLKLETQLAEASRTPVQLRDREGAIQQKDHGRAGGARAQRELAGILEGHRRCRHAERHRRPARVLRAGQFAPRFGLARRVAQRICAGIWCTTWRPT